MAKQLSFAALFLALALPLSAQYHAASGSDTIQHFTLKERYILLNEAVVTSGNDLVSIKESGKIGVNISQVRYAPSFMGEADMVKYLQMMPGVSSGREGSSQLVVRGGGGDQTLMMLDDIPIFNQNHAFGLISIFNSDALSGAELYKGYIPARYGGRLSSVASMRMRDGNRSQHHQSLTLGTLSMGALLEGPVDRGKGSYIVSARRFTPDLLLRPVYALQKRPDFKTLYSFYDLNAKVSYSLGDKSKLSASFYNGRDRYVNDVYDYNDDDIKVAEGGAGFGWGNTSASLRFETQRGKNLFLTHSVWFSNVDNKLQSNYKDILDGDESLARTHSQMYETGLRSVVEQKIGKRHRFTYGIHATYQHFSPQTTSQTKNGLTTQRGFPSSELFTGSLFLEERIALGKVSLDAGVRASIFNNRSHTLWGFEPRFAANVAIDKNNKTYLSYTRSLQPLTSIVKPYLGFPLDFWIPYDGNTLPSSHQLSAGWSHTRSQNLTFTLEGYYKRLRNITLIFAPDDYLTGESAAMQASGYAYGIEFMAVYTHNRWSLTGAYTYARSMRKVEESTFPFTFDTPHNANIYTTYTTLHRDQKNHRLSLNLNARSGLPFILSEGSYVAGGPCEDNPLFPNTRLKPYFRSDVSYSMERAKPNGVRVWQFSILNVTNHKNPYIVYKSGDQYKYSTLIPFMPSFSYKRSF